MNHPSIGNLQSKLGKNQAMIKNPYKEAYQWAKSELMDVTSQLQALQGIDIVMQSREDSIKKTSSNQKELEKLESGKKTLKSIFKSKGKKE